MNLPEPYASAPTPRTDAIDSQGKPENMTFTEWVNLLHTSHKQLERENLWLREVVEKLVVELQDCDSALDPTYKVQHRANREALSAYTQLQEYLKVQDVKTNN